MKFKDWKEKVTYNHAEAQGDVGKVRDERDFLTKVGGIAGKALGILLVFPLSPLLCVAASFERGSFESPSFIERLLYCSGRLVRGTTVVGQGLGYSLRHPWNTLTAWADGLQRCVHLAPQDEMVSVSISTTTNSITVETRHTPLSQRANRLPATNQYVEHSPSSRQQTASRRY